MPRLEVAPQRTLSGFPRFEHSQAIGGRPVSATRQTDSTRVAVLSARLDVSLVLHPAEGNVDRATFKTALRLLDKLQPKHLFVAQEFQHNPFLGRQARVIHTAIIDLTTCKSNTPRSQKPGA